MTDIPRDTPDQDKADDQAFSDDHPLASPNELAGDAQSGIDREFAARDAAEAEEGEQLEGDAAGAAAGIDYEEDTLPLEGN